MTPKEDDRSPFDSLKRFWTYIKHKKTAFNGIAPLKKDGKLTTDPKSKAEILNAQFQSVFTRETEPSLTPPCHQSPTMPDICITTNGVLKLLKNLKPNKAPGPTTLAQGF